MSSNFMRNHGNQIPEENEQAQGQPGANPNVTPNQNPGVPGQDENYIYSVGLGGITNSIFQSNHGEFSDYLVKLKERIEIDAKEHIAKYNYPIQFHFIDKNNPNTALACSTVVASLKSGNEVLFFWFLLSHTGKEAMSIGELMTEFEKNFQYYSDIQRQLRQDDNMKYRTLDVYIDENFYTILYNVMAKDYGTTPRGLKFTHVNGSIFNPTLKANTIEEVSMSIINTACTNLVIEKEVYIDRTVKDINIQNSFSNFNKDVDFKIKIKNNPTNSKQDLYDHTGNIIRQDFKVELSSIKRALKTESISYNKPDNEKLICSVGGYVDALPFNQDMPLHGPYAVNNGYQQPMVRKPRLSPHIIITDTATAIPTLGFKLLSIAVACNMLDLNNYLSVLYNNIGTKNDPGNLNLITNLDDVEKQEKIGIIDFQKMKTEQEIKHYLKLMFTGEPVVSLDILPFTAQSHVDDTFAKAATSSDPRERAEALDDIIHTASQLTNGFFPDDFNREAIFAYAPIPFPYGSLSVNNIPKDLRNVDLAMILPYIHQNQDLLKLWLGSNTPQPQEGFDPFFAKLKVCSTAINNKDSVISLRGVRITFHASFIKTLINAVYHSGLVPTYEAMSSFQSSDYSLDPFSAYYNNAKVDSGLVFGQQMFNTPYFGNTQFMYSPFGRGY